MTDNPTAIFTTFNDSTVYCCGFNKGIKPADCKPTPNQSRKIKLLNPLYVPVNRAKRFIKEGRAARSRTYEATMRCQECAGPYQYRYNVCPTIPRSKPLDDKKYMNDQKFNLSEELMDREFYNWFYDLDNDTDIAPILPIPICEQHHMRHHEKPQLEKKSTGFERICCSECDFPYSIYKRRYPPHLYAGIKVLLPRICAKTGLAAQVSHRKQSATEFDKLRLALTDEKADEAKRISSHLFADMVEEVKASSTYDALVRSLDARR